MPYKDKRIQSMFEKNWREEHSEDLKWAFKLWVEENRERKRELDAASRKRHQEYYNWSARFKRTLKNLSDDTMYIEVLDMNNAKCKLCNIDFVKKHHAQKYCTKECAEINRVIKSRINHLTNKDKRKL